MKRLFLVMVAAVAAVAVHAQVGCSLVVQGVCWADRHLSAPGTFAANDGYTFSFYQFNRRKTWGGYGDELQWTSTPATGYNEKQGWLPDNMPCPKGWRLPTQEEYRRLHHGSVPRGGLWVEAGERGNSVAGRIYGPNAGTCSLPDNMEGCTFFPASGFISRIDGSLQNRGSHGYSWSSTQHNATTGSHLSFNSADSNPHCSYHQAIGFPVRCVR